MNSLHLEMLNEASRNRDLFTIFSKEAKARNAETEDIVRGIYGAIVSEFVGEMESEPTAAGIDKKVLEFAAVYMLGGTMQAIEYFLFGSEEKMTKEELAEMITMIESRISGIDVHDGMKPGG
jgi:hypothetical protein